MLAPLYVVGSNASHGTRGVRKEDSAKASLRLFTNAVIYEYVKL